MKRTVGATLILLTFTVTACSGSDRSWSEFEACARSFGVGTSRDDGFDRSIRNFRAHVEEYRDTGKPPEPVSWFESILAECEKVMPLSD